MTISVTFKSEILGSGEFWRGDKSQVAEIRNIPARQLAEKVAKDGVERSTGMWTVRSVD